MRRPHIRRVAIAVAVTTAATLPGPAFAAVPDGPARVATSASSPVAAARAAAFAHAAATGVTQGDTLQAKDVMTDPDGKQHVRFVRTHRGLPVLGGDLVVHLGRRGEYLGVTRAADHVVKPSTVEAKLTPQQAEQKAAAAAKGDAGAAELVVDARDGAAALAYQVLVSDSDTTEAGGSRTVVVDARDGRIRSNTPDSDEFISPSLADTLREHGESATPRTGTAPALAGLTSAAAAGHYPVKATGSGASSSQGRWR